MKPALKGAIIAVVCIIIAAGSILFYYLSGRSISAMAEDENAEITFFTRFGTTLNLTGEASAEGIDVEDVKIVMTDDKAMYTLPCEYSLEGERISFSTSELINGGIQLEALPEGNWALLLRVEGMKGSKELIRYYPMVNGSIYDSISYRGISSPEGAKHVEFFFGDRLRLERDVACLDVESAPLPEDVYDVVLEVGHGGDDPGAIGWLDEEMYTEFSFNHTIAMEIKRILTERGYKAALTHEDNSDPEGYGPGGRAVVCNELHAKYSLSIHNNASVAGDYSGTEIFAPGNADYTFAELLSAKVVEYASYEISNADNNTPTWYSPAKGVWVRLYNEDDVIETNTEAAKHGAKEPYENLTVMKTNWYYMIREVGGISTGAYTDGRHDGWPANPYWDSNDTCEGIIVECDYVNNPVSLARLIDHPGEYARAVADAFCEYVGIIRTEAPEEIVDWKKGL